MDALLNKVAGKEEIQREDKQKKRFEDIEVKAVMNDMLNKVSQDYMDTKFENSIMEIVKSLSGYVGTVNDTSSKQYEDFNKNLRESFSMSL